MASEEQLSGLPPHVRWMLETTCWPLTDRVMADGNISIRADEFGRTIVTDLDRPDDPIAGTHVFEDLDFRGAVERGATVEERVAIARRLRPDWPEAKCREYVAGCDHECAAAGVNPNAFGTPFLGMPPLDATLVRLEDIDPPPES
jgi:hypothetical protein